MTSIDFGRFKCVCGHKFKSQTYDTVNIKADPGLKDKVLSREINTVSCPKCGSRQELVSRFLYHDQEKHLFIWCIPNSERRRRDEIEKEFNESVKNVNKIHSNLKDSYTIKCVFGYDELLQILVPEFSKSSKNTNKAYKVSKSKDNTSNYITEVLRDYKVAEKIIVLAHNETKDFASKSLVNKKKFKKPLSKKEIGIFLELLYFWPYFLVRQVFAKQDSSHENKEITTANLLGLIVVGLAKLKIVPNILETAEYFLIYNRRCDEYDKCNNLYSPPDFHDKIDKVDPSVYIKLQNEWVNDNLLQKVALKICDACDDKRLDGMTPIIVSSLLSDINIFEKKIATPSLIDKLTKGS